jgi:hypothetical protein
MPQILKYFILFFACSTLLVSCVPPSGNTNGLDLGSANAKILVNEDNVYEDRIKTVLFYPSGSSATSVLNPPILNRQSPAPLMLEFDDLGKTYCNYYAKVYHYNQNWTRSNYTDLQIVNDYNETLITNYSASINTKVRYSHYKFIVPKVKLSGNYLLVVYRNGDQSDIVISKRFIAYDPIVEISTNIQFPTEVKDRNTKQQVDFTISYGTGFEIVNPQDIKVLIRQNYRWDNAILLKQPLYIKSDKRQLDYSFFDGQNRFEGGNEFRYFDTRNLRIKGMNVETNSTNDSSNTIHLVTDINRNSNTYSEQIDINGLYVIQRAESQEPGTEADYANVFFKLKTAPDFDGDVYVTGQLTGWNLKPKYKMDYSSETGLYTKNLLLKQGFYNYQYCLKEPTKTNWNYFDGSYNTTENYYDIIVYYRPANQFNDVIIGYEAVNYRGRN